MKLGIQVSEIAVNEGLGKGPDDPRSKRQLNNVDSQFLAASWQASNHKIKVEARKPVISMILTGQKSGNCDVKGKRRISNFSMIQVCNMPWLRCLILQENSPNNQTEWTNEIVSGLFLLSTRSRKWQVPNITWCYGQNVLWGTLSNHSTHVYWAPRCQGQFWALGRQVQLRYIALILPLVV